MCWIFNIFKWVLIAENSQNAKNTIFCFLMIFVKNQTACKINTKIKDTGETFEKYCAFLQYTPQPHLSSSELKKKIPTYFWGVKQAAVFFTFLYYIFFYYLTHLHYNGSKISKVKKKKMFLIFEILVICATMSHNQNIH